MDIQEEVDGDETETDCFEETETQSCLSAVFKKNVTWNIAGSFIHFYKPPKS